jgi:hypothetical protein
MRIITLQLSFQIHASTAQFPRMPIGVPGCISCLGLWLFHLHELIPFEAALLVHRECLLIIQRIPLYSCSLIPLFKMYHWYLCFSKSLK